MKRPDAEILHDGEHLSLRRRRGWEYVEHRKAREAILVVAMTPKRELVLVEEFRPALNAPVICLPAGLVGDEGPEEHLDAAVRELAEETGFRASSWRRLGSGPGSAGATSEIVTFFLAHDARAVCEQAQADREQIRVHVVPVVAVPEWALAREQEGALIDPKIWAGLFLAGESGKES